MTGWTLADALDDKWAVSFPTDESCRMDEVGSPLTVGPAAVYSDFMLTSNQFSMTLEILGPVSDDDFIGIVFGGLDEEHMYLLDWKRYAQYQNWGDPVVVNDDLAEAGIKLKKIDGSWTMDGLWGGTDGAGVSTLAGPVAGPTGSAWVPDTPYTFEVQMGPTDISIKLNGNPIIQVTDNSFRNGLIGCYGFSQDNLLFSDVIPEPATSGLLLVAALVLSKRRRRGRMSTCRSK